MGSRWAYFFPAFVVILTLNMISPVKLQSTERNCTHGDSSINIAADIQNLKSELLGQLFKQGLKMQQLTESLHEMKSQHDTVIRSLEAIDRRLDEHDISNRNQTQNSWALAIAVGIDLEEGPVLPPIVNNWIVLMHRFDGSVNFYRNWIEYRNGFGNRGSGEFWLGNENIHRLTNTFAYTLRIEVQLNATGRWYYADYATFSLDSGDNKYAFRLSGFTGNAGDSLTNNVLSSGGYHGGMSFSTWDNDNDRDTGSCAQYHQAGWWFNSCFYSCLTCPYGGVRFQWSYFTGWETSGVLRAARMMIKSI